MSMSCYKATAGRAEIILRTGTYLCFNKEVKPTMEEVMTELKR